MAPREVTPSRMTAKSIVQDIEEYVDLSNNKHEYFHRGLLGLKIVPLGRDNESRGQSRLVSRVDFVQPGRPTAQLRLRRVLLDSGQEAESLEDLRYGMGKYWFQLRPWVDRRYGKSAMRLENAADFNLFGFIQEYITRRGTADMDFWAKAIGLSISFRILDQSAHWACVLRYPQEPKIILRIRRAPGHDHVLANPDAAKIQIEVHGYWRPLISWLESLLRNRSVVHYTQQFWWANNGLAFRFMDLPPELRLCVYEQISGTYTWPHPVTSSTGYSNSQGEVLKVSGFDTPRLTLNKVYWNYDTNLRLKFLDPREKRPPSSTYLPYANKTIATEFTHFAKVHTVKHFARPSVLLQILPVLQPHCLRRISLGMTNTEYLELLGYKAMHHRGFQKRGNGPTGITILVNVSTLEHLNLDFQIMPPTIVSREWCSGDPWFNIRSRPTTRVSCQKVVVDWLLTLALAHIRHIRKVTLSGHIKQSTRMGWERIMELEREGRPLHASKAVQDILSTPWQYLPFPRLCSYPCDWWLSHGPFQENEVEIHRSEQRLISDREHSRFICED